MMTSFPTSKVYMFVVILVCTVVSGCHTCVRRYSLRIIYSMIVFVYKIGYFILFMLCGFAYIGTI